MTNQTLQVGPQPHCTISGAQGDLEVLVGDGRDLVVESEAEVAVERGEGQSYTIHNVVGPLRLVVPHDATVHVHDHTGDLRVSDCAALVVSDGPRSFSPGERRGVEDVTVQNVASVEIENVGGTLALSGAERVTVGNVGGACSIEGVGGPLRVANVGGSATLRAIGAVEGVGNIGGKLTMSAAPLQVAQAGSRHHIAVGGGATIELPPEADVAIEAIVGGGIHGPGLALSGPGMHRVVYGEGKAELHLVVGGGIELRGGGTPRATGSSWGSWAKFGAEIGHTVAGAVASMSRAVEQAREVGRPAHRDVDAERRAILQMVAEGQISPAEADTMLG